MHQPDMRTREARAAQQYMQRKGYGDVKPYGVIPVEDQNVWYYYYNLPEGTLELEVCQLNGEWRWHVTAFQMTDHKRRENIMTRLSENDRMSNSRYLEAV